MAASFTDLSKIANSFDFQTRVGYAMLMAAINVYSETPTPQTPVRKQFALRIIQSGGTSAAYSMAVLTNATIAAEANISTATTYGIPDGDIQFAVNSLWNALSGV